jgi:hypothetical protein
MTTLKYISTSCDGDTSLYEAIIDEESLVVKRDSIDSNWTEAAKGTEVGEVKFPFIENNIELTLYEFQNGLTGKQRHIDFDFSEALDVYILLKSYFDSEKINGSDSFIFPRIQIINTD